MIRCLAVRAGHNRRARHHLDIGRSDGATTGLAFHLADLGIAGQINIHDHLLRSGIGSTDLARAQAIWRKKFGDVAVETAERHKQARFLAARGFGGEVIRRVVAGIDDELPSDI